MYAAAYLSFVGVVALSVMWRHLAKAVDCWTVQQPTLTDADLCAEVVMLNGKRSPLW